MKHLLTILILKCLLCFSLCAQNSQGTIQIKMKLQDNSDSLIIYFKINHLIDLLQTEPNSNNEDSVNIMHFNSFKGSDTIQYRMEEQDFSWVYPDISSHPNLEHHEDYIFKMIRKKEAALYWITSGKQITNLKTRKRIAKDDRGNKMVKIREYFDKDSSKLLFYEGLGVYGKF